MDSCRFNNEKQNYTFFFPSVYDNRKNCQQEIKCKMERRGQIKWRCIKTVNGRGVEQSRRKRDEKKLFCHNPLSSHSVSQKGSALSGALLSSTSRGATFSLFPSLFFSSFPPLALPSLPFSPSLIPKAEWQPFTSHQTHFMTAAALHSCWTVCLKGFLTRPWIRLVASHSLFLSARLDSDADIKWTQMQSPTRRTHTTTCLPFCGASEAAKTASSERRATSWLFTANITL